MYLESSLERELYEARKARLARYAAVQFLPSPKVKKEPEPQPKYSIGPDANDHVKRRLCYQSGYIPSPSVRHIVCAVAEEYSVSVVDILSHRRTAKIVLPRQMTMYLATTITTKSLPEIGRMLGGRDHTTVLHGKRKIERLMESSPALRAKIEELRNIILNGSGKADSCAP